MAGLPFGLRAVNLSGQNRQSIDPRDKMLLDALQQQAKQAGNIDYESPEAVAARKAYAKAFEEITGRKFPEVDGGEQEAPDMTPEQINTFAKKNGKRIFAELKKQLGRSPTAEEVKAEMIRQASENLK